MWIKYIFFIIYMHYGLQYYIKMHLVSSLAIYLLLTNISMDQVFNATHMRGASYAEVDSLARYM